MNFQCPKCSLTGQVDDSKIPAEGSYAVCPKCKTRFLVTSSSPEPQNKAVKATDAKSAEVVSEKLKPCPACGNNISKSARICPRCGKKLKMSRVLVGTICLVSFVVFVAILGSFSKKEGKAKTLATTPSALPSAPLSPISSTPVVSGNNYIQDSKAALASIVMYNDLYSTLLLKYYNVGKQAMENGGNIIHAIESAKADSPADIFISAQEPNKKMEALKSPPPQYKDIYAKLVELNTILSKQESQVKSIPTDLYTFTEQNMSMQADFTKVYEEVSVLLRSK